MTEQDKKNIRIMAESFFKQLQNNNFEATFIDGVNFVLDKVSPKIAELYKQNDIPMSLDNSKLKHYLDWECEKSNLIDFIIEITEILKTDSNFSE